MEQTASITAFVSIFSISSLIEFYGKPLLAPIADYFDRLTVYKVCIALAAVCVGALIFIVIYIKFSIYLLMGPLLLLSAIAALRDPASAGLVPVLVDSEHLIKAQSLRSSIGSVISLGTPMFSALLLSMGGSKIALITAGIASVVSLFFTLGIRQIQEEIIVPKSWGEYVKTWYFRTINGLRAVFMTRSERVTAIVVAITNAGLFPFFFCGAAIVG
ncbi:MFS transporter [Acinetobacter baumannii]|uniref:MFS transporter n=1 Tax=Acinetobacter baumannii TaxID=470 RepID=UPI003CFFECBB